MYPVLLQFGPLTIYSYGVMMAVAFLVSGWVLGKALERQGKDAALSSTLVLWAAIGGLIGARLLFIVERFSEFLANPGSFIFTGAGFTWYGGLIGGVAALAWCVRRHDLPWLSTMDAVAPVIALGHGIGRIGCHLAGDGDWGPPTTLPWGVAYPDAIVGWPYNPGVYVHPTPLYEMAAYLAIFALLWSRLTAPPKPGAVFWEYLLLAGTARFLLEFVRVNVPVLLGLSQAQIISILIAVVGAVMLARKGEQAAAGQSFRPLAQEKRR